MFEDVYGHYPLRLYLRRSFFDQYWKFAIVRNPHDRVVSAFFYLLSGGSNFRDKQIRDTLLRRYRQEFREFTKVLWRLRNQVHFLPQYRFVANRRGSVLHADELFDFEKLWEMTTQLRNRYSLTAPLPRLNSSSHSDYHDYYDRHSWNRVKWLYKKDFDLLQRETWAADSYNLESPNLRETRES